MNRAPVPVVCTATTREDISVEVPISGSDADGNALTVFLTKLPSRGYLTVNKSTTARVALSTSYNMPDGNAYAFFNYVPNLYYYGSDSFQYYLSDGCSITATISCSLTINYYNYPPVAIATSASILENTPSPIRLNGSDVETPNSRLVYFVTSLPDPTLGVLRRVSTGNLVVVNERLNPGEDTLQFVPVTYACCDIASFTFQVQDIENKTSTPATAEVDIIGVNQPPTVSANDATVERGSRTAIVLTASDPDRGDLETFTVTAASSGFTTAAGVAIPTSGRFNISTVAVNAAGNALVTIYYTAPANQAGANFASITFLATDQTGSSSSTKTVSVTVSTANKAPTANAAGPITLLQDSSSAIWNLNGTDTDAADANTLRIQITSLPSKGTLTQVNVSDIASSTTLPFTLTNPNIYYSTNSTGEDSFNFRVIDLMGAFSSQQLVRIVITAVNHAPTASFPAVTTPEDTPVIIQISPYDQDGDKVSVIITNVTRGYVYQADSNTPITRFPVTITDSLYRFKFMGLQDEFGTPYANISFYVTDNQNKPNSNSSVITGSISVTPVNDPPVAYPISLQIDENSGPVNFTLNVTDIESPTTVVAFLLSKPTALGTIKKVNGDALDIRGSVGTPFNVTFYPELYKYGVTTFTFGANDGTVDSDTAATGTITVRHINHPPSASATSPVTASRAVPLSITLTVRDFDVNDNLTVTIKNFNGGGVLSYNGVNITTSTYKLPAVTIPASNSRTIVLSYFAPANALPGANYASFSFDVVDQDSLSANTTTVSISIANNNVPVANPAGPLRVIQDYFSTPISLNGTDADVADSGSLLVVIQTLPTKGKLYLVGNTNNAISAGTLAAGVSQVIYMTNQRGNDSFTFAVTDLLGAVSAPVTVTVLITNTNHPPSIFWTGTAVANEDTVLNITNIQASDPDDGDKITVTVLVGPAKGSLSQFSDVLCTAPCNITDSLYRLRFTPLPNENSVNNAAYATISVVASDGMAPSSTIVGSLFITPVNDAPVAYNSLVPTDENQEVTITLNATDIDTQPDKVSAIIQTIPNPAIGTIKSLTGTTLQIGSVITGEFKQLKFVPTTWASGTTTFSFLLNDGEL